MNTTTPLAQHHDILKRLHDEFQLPAESIYLLHLVPLIEVMWADGRSQRAERTLIHEYSMTLQRTWAQKAGKEVISDQVVQDFFKRFLNQQPPAEELQRLRALLLELPHSETAEPALRLDTVLDLCLDVAACAVPHYPYGLHERITSEEKRIIKELVVQVSAVKSGSPATA